MKFIIKIMNTLLATLAVIYITILIVMTVFQRQFLYIPDKQIASPEQYGLSGFSEDFIKTSDNITIQTWFKAAAGNMPTIIYFNGNASHMGNRAGIYSALTNRGFGLLAISYRGYGKSEGYPTEEGLYRDARAAVEFLNKTKKIPLSRTMLYGESLGTGVSTKMASEYDFAAVILQAPYTSASDRAAEIYFFLPVKFIMLDHFSSLERIKRIKSPLLILHGELDEMIPIRHGKSLLEAANQPKEAIFFPDVGHNNFDSGAVADDVLNFAKKYNLVTN